MGLQASWKVWDWFTPSLVIGAATVLKPQNADDGILVGVEADAVLAFSFNDYLSGHLVGGILIPGAAAGRLGHRGRSRAGTRETGY